MHGIKNGKETAAQSEIHRISFLSCCLLNYAVGKRNSPDIIATILEAANGGIGKTRLLTKANLTSEQFKKYIDLLISKELLIELEEIDRRSAYKTTERGLQYLTLYDSIKNVSTLKT